MDVVSFTPNLSRALPLLKAKQAMLPNLQSDLALAALDWVHSQNYVNMTFRQAALLAVICDEPGPHTVRGLAEALGVSKPVVSRAVHALLVLGLTGRQNDPKDRRSVLVHPTATGREIRSAMAGQVDTHEMATTVGAEID